MNQWTIHTSISKPFQLVRNHIFIHHVFTRSTKKGALLGILEMCLFAHQSLMRRLVPLSCQCSKHEENMSIPMFNYNFHVIFRFISDVLAMQFHSYFSVQFLATCRIRDIPTPIPAVHCNPHRATAAAASETTKDVSAFWIRELLNIL